MVGYIDSANSSFLVLFVSPSAGADSMGVVCENRSSDKLLAEWRFRFAADALADEFGETDAILSGNHLGRLLTDHDARCVCVASNHRWHDAGVRDAQPV